MHVISPNGMVERFDDDRKRPEVWEQYGRRKDGAPRDERTIKLAVEQDRRDHPRDLADPFRGRLFNLTT